MFTFLATFSAVALVLQQLLDLWLRPTERQKLRELTEALWIRHSDLAPARLSRAPLEAVQGVVQATLGPTLASRRAFGRTMLVSALLLSVSMTAVGLKTGNPLGMSSWPWEELRDTADHFHELASVLEREAESSNATTATRAARTELVTKLRFLDGFRSAPWQLGYTLLVGVVVAFWNGAMSFAILLISHSLLRQLLHTDSALLKLASAVFYSAIGALLLSLGLIVMSLLTSPSVLVLAVSAPDWPGDISLEVQAFIALLWAGGAWVLGDALLRTVALTSVWPCLILVFALALSVAIQVIRLPAHRAIGAILLRASEHERSPLSFVVGFLALLSALAITIAN